MDIPVVDINTSQINFKDKQRGIEAAKDFEAVFLQQALKEMRPKLDNKLFNTGFADDLYYQFMDEAIAKEIVNSSQSIGIAEQVIKQNLEQ